MHSLFLKKIFLILLAFTGLIINSSVSAQDCNFRVSLLTASPGDELYSTFGHSALRIIDSTTHRDIVFNYGTFNFDESNFYLKFIRGKLKYFISLDEYNSFAYSLQLENRSITEQVLNLTCEEKMKLKAFLQWNLLPANMYYKYDFTFDNCTTRLRDLLETTSGDSVHFRPILTEPATFREAIHEYLDQNEKLWSKLGIDILLGRRLDRKMTNKEAMFLPNNLMHAVDSASINGLPLVKDKEVILKNKYVPHEHNNVTNPLFIFSCIFVIIAFLSFSGNRKIKRFLRSFDGFLFFLNGLIGILLLFMWVGTDHFMTKDNYNLLWAWPANIIMAFFVTGTRKWIKIYFNIYALAQILLLCLWFFLPQNMNIALIPINGILIFRCFLLDSLNNKSNVRDNFSK